VFSVIVALLMYSMATAAVSLESAPPVVVKTVPVAGTTGVSSGLSELQVTFSKPMQDGSWSWSTFDEDSFPEIVGQIRYLDDQRTCVLPVKLQPGRFYATWLNSHKFRNFRDADGRSAVPYLLAFTTATQSEHDGRAITGWVETFFKNNFRDLTARETLEWGPVETNANGTLSIRYMYRARIMGKHTVTNHQEFTFDSQGEFLSVTDIHRTSQEKMRRLVEMFFQGNFRDVTSRDTLEWGPVQANANGTWSIRYKYRARIWDRETVTNHQEFTFDSQDAFVSVTDVSQIQGPTAGTPASLTADQQAVVTWTDRQFRSYYDNRTFEGWTPEELAALETRCIDALNGPRSRDYYAAINTLGALRSTRALPRLRELAFERVDKNNRDRWMSVRILGMLGDQPSVPHLIHLLYHGNQNTHWWAQVALVQLTGQNFGGNWDAWGEWWNASGGTPEYEARLIRWWDGQPDTVEALRESLAEGDRKFLENL
jgi:RNA polymerase sigma-70 factor (ECF subfamily)